jgi:hypothetical protein
MFRTSLAKALMATAFVTLLTEATLAASCIRPGKPDLPNGASSNVGEMEKSEKAVGVYLDQLKVFVDCRQKEIDEIQSDIKKAVDEADGVKNTWNGEVDKFNATK